MMCDVIDTREYLGMTVRNAERDADTGQNGQVDDIVADESAQVSRQTGLLQKLRKGFLFLARSLDDMIDFQIGGTAVDDGGSARTDDGGCDIGSFQQLDAVSVQYIETFEQFSVFALMHFPVGQYAVHIENHQPDMRQFFKQVGIHQITFATVRS